MKGIGAKQGVCAPLCTQCKRTQVPADVTSLHAGRSHHTTGEAEQLQALSSHLPWSIFFWPQEEESGHFQGPTEHWGLKNSLAPGKDPLLAALPRELALVADLASYNL
jgi:hypothetical protein